MAEPGMTPAAILARLRRGFARIGQKFARLWARVQGRRQITEHQKETARETGAMLGIMAQANSAGADMSDEQRMLLIRAAPGMRAREAVLLAIPNRSVVEENELHMIRRGMAQLEGRDAPPGWVSRPRAAVAGFLGPLAAVGGLRLWMVFGGVALLAGGATAIQTARLDHAKNDLAETRADLAMTERALSEARATAQELARAVQAADALSHQTAANLEAERQRHARAAAVERRRQREIQDVLTGRDPPAWRLRDDGSGPPTDSGGAASGDPG